MTLYGICRVQGKCTCGLCRKIAYGSNKAMERAGRPPLKAKKPKPQKSYYKPKYPGMTPTERARAVWAKRDATKKAELAENNKLDYMDCGCILHKDRRIKWCYRKHDPQTDPNPH